MPGVPYSIELFHCRPAKVMLHRFNFDLGSAIPLSDLQIKQAKPDTKNTWLSDEKDLRLLIKPNKPIS